MTDNSLIVSSCSASPAETRSSAVTVSGSSFPNASILSQPESWPSPVLECLFSFLSLPDLRNCSLVCKSWHSFLTDENNDVWRLHCVRKLAADALKSDLLSSLPTYKVFKKQNIIEFIVL